MYLGIDLGTSNSAVVGYSGGKLTLFKASDGSDVLPSVIYADKRGHRFVGKQAQDRILLGGAANVAHRFKRQMGTNSPIRVGSETWTPEQCSAEIIRTLVGQATTESGESKIQGAVITIPAAFNQMQSQATLEAAEMAQLSRVGLLQEPVAAAMASIANTKQKDGVFLVYDLGGGTFDVALVMSTGGAANVIAHEGINMLGGSDFDRLILDAVVRPWLIDNFSLPQNFQADKKYESLTKIARFAAEKAKIQLTANETSSIFASEDEVRIQDEDGEDIFVSVDLTRDMLNSLISDKVEESIKLCRRVIEKNGYQQEDIARVVPIGGPSKMPFIREALRSELAIELEQGLDPMTAVATGAAIFAESRNWDEGKSERKTARRREAVKGAISLSIDFKDRVSEDSVQLRIQPGEGTPDGYVVEILDEQGGTSGRKTLEGPLSLKLGLRREGENRFRIVVRDPAGRVADDVTREITIVRTMASAAAIPMTYTLAVKTQTGSVGQERNQLLAVCQKNTPLPAKGEKRVRAAKALKGGEDDVLAIEFFEMQEGVDDPSLNLYIGDFRLRARDHLERGERIRRGDELVIRWEMSDNSTLSFSVEIPGLGRIIEASDFYSTIVSRKNYEGKQGASIAGGLLEAAQSDYDELVETLGRGADPSGQMRQKIEELDTALSTSADADTHRLVAEESRRVRQEMAFVRLAPANVERVLTKEVERAEKGFDDLMDDADEVETRRHERLLLDARRAIRERDFDGARHSIEEMKSIRFKLLRERPDFLLALFEAVAGDEHLAVDEDLHRRLVGEGRSAIKAQDISRLQGVIYGLFSNRIQIGSKSAEIVELADLLGAVS